MMNEGLELRTPERRVIPTPAGLLALLKRQRWVMLATAVIVAVVMVRSGILKPAYVAQMKILVLRHRVDAVITPQANSPVQWDSNQITEEELNSEVELLTSSDLLRQVVVETGLDRDPALGAQANTQRRIAAAAYMLGKHLKTESVRKTNVISVQYESPDPELASKVLTALSESYIAKHQEVLRPSGEFKFFDQQVAQYRRSLLDSRKELADLGEMSGVVAPDMERDLTVQRVVEFDESAHQAQESSEEDRARLNALRQELGTTAPQVTATVHTAANEPLLDSMQQNLNALEMKRIEMLQRYQPTYRPVQDLEEQIAAEKAQIEQAKTKHVQEETVELNPNYQALQLEIAKNEADVRAMAERQRKDAGLAEQYRQTAVRLNRQSLDREELMQDAKAQAENYVLYMQRREEARISDALDQRGIVNVAIAEHPAVPSFPKKTRDYGLMMMGLMCFTFSVSAAVVTDMMAPSFRTVEETATYLDAPVLAYLPKHTEGERRE